MPTIPTRRGDPDQPVPGQEGASVAIGAFALMTADKPGPLGQDEMAAADGVIDILRHRRDDRPGARGVHPGQQDRRNDRASLQLIGRQRRRQGVAIIGGADVRSVRTSAGRRWTRPGMRGRTGPG